MMRRQKMYVSISTGVYCGIGLSCAIYLYIASHTVRYYTKYTVFALSAMFSATIYIPLMLWRPGSYKNALLPAWTLKQVGKLFGLQFEIKGKENIVQNTGAIVLINHQSMLDLLVLAELWPILPNACVIAKKEIFYIWPFGLATWLWGTIFIDRLNRESATNTINSTADTINKRQAKLCMFPEGTRYGGRTLLPFKKGAFHVAIQSECPLQPVVVSRYHFVDHKKHIFNSGKSVISILPAVKTEGFTRNRIDGLISELYSTMNREYGALSNDVLSETKKIK